MRDHDAHEANLRALSQQEGAPPGYVSIESVATMLELRDELIHDLKRVIEEDAREQLRIRRKVVRVLPMTSHEQPPKCDGCSSVMLDEYVVIAHRYICPDCFKNRSVHRVDPSVVGWYIAGQALAGVRHKTKAKTTTKDVQAREQLRARRSRDNQP